MKLELYDKYREVEASHWWFEVRRKIIRDLFLKYNISNKSKILDVGCNYGYFVGELQKQGFEYCFGTDISKQAIEYGIQKGIKNLSVSLAEKLSHPDNTFDLTMALDVIEHIEDDKMAIREISRITKPGGYFFVMVPAYMYLWSLQDDVAKHFRRYNKKTLASSIENSGFEIVRMTYFNSILFFPIMIIRKLEHFTKTNRSSDFDLNNALTNSILKIVFGLEKPLLRFMNFPFGVSILMIARKK